MTTSTLTSTDQKIQQSVQDELRWAPDVNAPGIGVAVENGTVTLSGEVDDSFELRAAARAALRTIGVTTVVDDLVIHPSSYSWAVSETDIAEKVQDAIKWYAKLPDSVRATIDHHVVTLTGEVSWNYERVNARRVVDEIKGVSLVVNSITLRPRVSAPDTEQRIREALTRNSMLDAGRIHVAVAGGTVTLTGHVRSFAERTEAVDAAWSSPHASEVVDHLTVTG